MKNVNAGNRNTVLNNTEEMPGVGILKNRNARHLYVEK